MKCILIFSLEMEWNLNSWKNNLGTILWSVKCLELKSNKLPVRSSISQSGYFYQLTNTLITLDVTSPLSRLVYASAHLGLVTQTDQTSPRVFWRYARLGVGVCASGSVHDNTADTCHVLSAPSHPTFLFFSNRSAQVWCKKGKSYFVILFLPPVSISIYIYQRLNNKWSFCPQMPNYQLLFSSECRRCSSNQNWIQMELK